MEFGSAPLDPIDDRHLDMRSIHEAMLDHLVERVRLGEKGEHVVVTPGDDGMEGVEKFEERLAPSITPL